MSALLKALSRLQQQAELSLAASSLTQAQRTALDDFSRNTNCIRRETAGRGVVYRVVDSLAFENHWRQLCPLDIDGLPEQLPQRAVNIAGTRHSKQGPHGHNNYYLLLKATGNDVQWQNGNSRLDLSYATNEFGAATLAIDANDGWVSDRNLWLIENQALFDQLDWFPDEPASSIAWYSGHLNNLLLDWLANKPRAQRVILFPDYDGVGLMNFARLQQRLGDRCEFWLMPDWRQKLKQFGTNKIWCDTLREFQFGYKHLQTASEGELLELMDVMQKTALALEQESVWLS